MKAVLGVDVVDVLKEQEKCRTSCRVVVYCLEVRHFADRIRVLAGGGIKAGRGRGVIHPFGLSRRPATQAVIERQRSRDSCREL